MVSVSEVPCKAALGLSTPGNKPWQRFDRLSNGRKDGAYPAIISPWKRQPSSMGQLCTLGDHVLARKPSNFLTFVRIIEPQGTGRCEAEMTGTWRIACCRM